MTARLHVVLCTAIVAAAPAPTSNVLVCYYSQTGHTKALASAIADGARAVAGTSVRVSAIEDTDVEADLLTWADAVVIGSPVHYGNVAGALQSWVEAKWEPFWTDARFGTKLGAVFATGGGLNQGVEHVITSLQRLLFSFRVRVLTPDPTRSGFSSYGAVAITGTPPFNMSGGAIAQPFAEAAQALGMQVADVLTSALVGAAASDVSTGSGRLAASSTSADPGAPRLVQ